MAFHWIGTTNRFWFVKQTEDQSFYVVIDANHGEEVMSFAESELVTALIGHKDADAPRASLSHLDFEPELNGLSLEWKGRLYRCELPLGQCSPVDGGEPTGADNVVSPDSRWSVFRRADDLWLRERASGQEKQLTRDGQPHFGYGDWDRLMDLNKVARRRLALPDPLRGVRWSPDSRYVVAMRQDLRPYPERLIVTEYLPPTGTTSTGDWAATYLGRFATAADASTPATALSIIDVETGTLQKIKMSSQALNYYALDYFIEGPLWWGAEGRSLFLLTSNRGGSRCALVKVNLANGVSKEIIAEEDRVVRLNPSDYARPNVWVASSGKEFIWYSERSGFGHLYLYDGSTGQMKHELTHGEQIAFDLLHVDEVRRFAYFTAARAGDPNVYHRYLYRVSLDGGREELLTPEWADHEFRNGYGYFHNPYGSTISPSGKFFVDVYSTTDSPPRITIRRNTGRLVREFQLVDTAVLSQAGWKPPRRIVVKAADGVTNLYGVMYLPKDFDDHRRYPLIEYMYPGPQSHFAPISFAENFSIERLSNPLTEAGFIVVFFDARGTGYRSREFRDTFLGTEDVFGAVDHVAAIKNLASQYSFVDIGEIGVMGASFGGYGSLRALLLYPGFFKVAVSAVGPGDWLNFQSGISVERFFGVSTDSPEARAYYDTVSNTRLADRLRGKLLLIYGGIDENVPLKHAFVVLDSFIKAGKDVDMLILPDAAHGVWNEAYALNKTVDYFNNHLTHRDSSP